MPNCEDHKDVRAGIDQIQRSVSALQNSSASVNTHIDKLISKLDGVLERLGSGEVNFATIGLQIQILQSKLDEHLEDHKQSCSDWKQTALNVVSGGLVVSFGIIVGYMIKGGG